MAIFSGFRGAGGRRGGYRRGVPTAPVAVVDLGATTIKSLIARRTPGGIIEVIGIGKAPSRGVKAGAVVDMDAAEADIRAAVEEAEAMAGAPVDAVTIGFAGGQIASDAVFGETLLGEKPADDRDLRRALDAALQNFDAEGCALLHAIPLAWSIDDHGGVQDPRGMFGRSLGVDVHVVTASAGPVRNLALCVERARLELAGVVATPYASGLATLVPDEIDLGVTLIDLGGGVTSAAVFIDGALVHVDAARIGGAHISNDLARGLSTPIAEAEQIKRRFGGIDERCDEPKEPIMCPQLGDAHTQLQVSCATVRDIVRPRVEETLEIMRDRLAAAGVLRAAGPRVVLTGGASRLPGVEQVAADILGKRVRVAKPYGVEGLPEGDDGPEMACAVGLLRHVLGGPREAISGPPRIGDGPRPRNSDFSGVKQAASWLKRNF